MKNILFTITCFLFLSFAYGQAEGYGYLRESKYIINENYVIYQDYEGRKIIYPDIETFEIRHNRSHYFDGIALDKNGVYFKGVFLAIDTAGITILGKSRRSTGDLIWKTNTRVFKNTEEIIGADAPTFKSIHCGNSYYYKDKNFVYYGERKIPGSDGKTVDKSCNSICYDKNHVYMLGQVMHYNEQKVFPVNDHLFKTETEVFDRNLKVVEGADAKSFAALSSRYSKDKNRLYYNSNPCQIELANYENLTFWDEGKHAYFTDGINLFRWSGYQVDSIDLSTFGVIPKSEYIYDKNGIYKWQYDHENNKRWFEKIPFNYHSPVTVDNSSKEVFYYVYCKQAYNERLDTLYTDLSPEELSLIKSGHLLPKDKVKLVSKPQPIPEFTYFPNTPFKIREGHIYYRDSVLIRTEKLELLAIFSGYRPGCGLDKTPSTNFYFLKNVAGYWIIESTKGADPVFLGTKFNPDWDPIFTDFEFPK